MKFAVASLALFVAMAAGQTFTINTPLNVVECQPTLLTWSGGTAPYFLSVLPGAQPGAAALEDLGTQTGTTYTWKTDIAAGTSVGLTLRDSTGATAQSAAFTINPGTTGCLAGGSSSSAASSSGSVSAGGSSSSSSIAGSSTPAVTTPAVTTPASTAAATTTKPASSSSSSSKTTTGASASPSSGAARVNAVNMGVAGVVGAAVFAILA